mmetsp:Transcript_56169/g.93181  ORF Transcript_56169/g.93181 Transcript_56169/m.93181 type:complete len:424 (-) Transcript_56169:73-1344(-)
MLSSSATYVSRNLRGSKGRREAPSDVVPPNTGSRETSLHDQINAMSARIAVDPMHDRTGSRLGTDVTVALIGPPGDGKSTLGNLLAGGGDGGPTPFRICEDFNSVGCEVAHADFAYEEVGYRVIDTTGLFEGATNAAERLASCAGLSPNGIDAFIFVIRKGRFTEEYFDQLRSFEQAAGSGSLKRTVIVFSHCGREANDQLLNRCRRSGNSHLREALQRTAGIVGVDSCMPNRATEDRAAVLAATARICREHQSVPKPMPMDPATLRQTLAEMDNAINSLSHERQDVMKAKMDSLRTGHASLDAVRRALAEASGRQQGDNARYEETRDLASSVSAAQRERDTYRDATNSVIAREAGGPVIERTSAFACCTPTNGCPGPCEPCDNVAKVLVQDWHEERQKQMRNKFAEADKIADLNYRPVGVSR